MGCSMYLSMGVQQQKLVRNNHLSKYMPSGLVFTNEEQLSWLFCKWRMNSYKTAPWLVVTRNRTKTRYRSATENNTHKSSKMIENNENINNNKILIENNHIGILCYLVFISMLTRCLVSCSWNIQLDFFYKKCALHSI